jgi:putative transposase
VPLNPVRAHLIHGEQRLAHFRWSSYPRYLGPPRRPAWLRVDRWPGEHGVPQDSAAGRRYLAAALEARRPGEQAQEFKTVRRGWCSGDQTFRQELLRPMQGRRGAHHYGEEHFESDEAKALGIVEEELPRRGWEEEDLQARRQGDKHNVAIAARLRRETTMTLKWIAARLRMGSWNTVSNRLAAARQRKR